MTFPFAMHRRADATISQTDAVADNTTQTTYTFSTRAIGSAALNRAVIVGVGGLNVTAGRTISSLTVGGASATSINFQQTSAGGVFVDVGLYALRVDSGTTATVVITWSAAQVRTMIGVWAAYGVDSLTASATAQSSANPMSASLSIPAGGIGVGFLADFQGAAAPTHTWANLTESFDIDVGGGSNTSYSGAQTALVSASSPTISATPSVFTGGYMVLASFR